MSFETPNTRRVASGEYAVEVDGVQVGGTHKVQKNGKWMWRAYIADNPDPAKWRDIGRFRSLMDAAEAVIAGRVRQ